MSGANLNPLEMSDEDIAKMDSPPVVETQQAVENNSAAEAVPVVEEPVQDNQQGADDGEASKTEDAGSEDQGKEGEGVGNESEGSEGNAGSAAQPKTEGEPAKTEPEAEKPEGAVPATGSKPEGQAAGGTPAVVDHKGFYEAVMKPFVANGKTIELESPEEVIQLMQQGANYTRKMQAIAPHRKMLTMLENNGLLSEDKLSFLIDLEKGDPAAVQKLLKDKNIDTMSIDTESEATYQAGNHKVSDNEVAFRTNLEELNSIPEGKETLQIINSTWDDASKEVLWGEPSLMPVIHAQKQNGIYDRIVAEVDRRKLLGKIAPETSFIDAYRSVGDEMFLAPKPAEQAPAVTTPVVAAQPVATTAATPKPVVENGDKAGAASPTRSTPKTAKAIVNPLALSDEEFEAQYKQFQGRV